MRAVLVDDEPKALEALRWLLASFCPQVQVAAVCSSVAEALPAIDAHRPDVVFLDIEMPVQNGFDLLTHYKTLPFAVVFTTAYDRFALKAIKFSAADYLLKPVDPDELQAAVKKIAEKDEGQPTQQRVEALVYNYLQGRQNRFALPSKEGLIFLEADDILRAESESNYTRIHLTDGQKVMLSKTLKEVEALLEGAGFYRVHYSHLINLKHIKSFSRRDGATLVMKDNTEVDVARNRKEAFLELFKKL